MSPETNAPATADGAGTGPPDATTDAVDAERDGRGIGHDDRDGDCDAPDTERGVDESDLRTVTRLLRLVKLALGALVSLLTALKLLGFV